MFLSKNDSFEIRFFKNRIDCCLFSNLEKESIYSILNCNIQKICFVSYLNFDDISEGRINDCISKFFNDNSKDVFQIHGSAEFILRNIYKKKLNINDQDITTNLSMTFNTTTNQNKGKK